MLYTMQRTQIYLSDADLQMLDREVARTGRNRSRLIRDAIVRAYGHRIDADTFEAAVRSAAGAWRDRPFTGAEYVDAIRDVTPDGPAALWHEGHGPGADSRR